VTSAYVSSIKWYELRLRSQVSAARYDCQRDLPLPMRRFEASRSPVASSQRRLHSRQVASLGEEVIIRRDTFLRHRV